MSSSISPLSKLTDISGSLSAVKKCSQCSRNVKANPPYRTCQRCRDKDRAKRGKKKKDKEETYFIFPSKSRKESPVKLKRSDDDIEDVQDVAVIKTVAPKSAPVHSQEHSDATSISTEKSIRLKQFLTNVVAVSQRQPGNCITCKKHPATLNHLCDDCQGLSSLLRATDRIQHIRAFQTQDDLMQELMQIHRASSDTSSKVAQFKGAFSIIATHRINNYQRVKIVVKAIRREVQWPLGVRWPLASSRGGSKRTYACGCRGLPPNDPNDKRLHEESSNRKPYGLCNGKVIVSVMKEDSHPCSIPGQKVVVQVRHNHK